MKLFYLIAGTYRSAGMERVLAEKAGWLASHGYDVTIVTTDQKGRPDAYPTDSRVRRIDLEIGYEDNNGGALADKLVRYPFKQLKHRRRLSKLLKRERPDITISMFCNDASFLPKIKDGSRKILEYHFSRLKRVQYGRKGLWALADRMRSAMDARTVRRFDRFVVLTAEDAALWGSIPGMEVIPNPRTFKCTHPSDAAARKVLAAGRYCHQKGFERLLEAWSRIDTEGWTLRIAGEGAPLPQNLLKPNVITGPAQDILDEYLSSSIFALSSRYEGLPMVLLEAQAAGLPIVSFTCQCGPKDIVTPGRDGILVPEGDVDALAGALETLMGDENLRRRMGEEAFRNSDKYDLDSIMPKWTRIFEKL